MAKKRSSSNHYPGAYEAKFPVQESGANVIKRYRVNYTTSQKVRFGMLPPSALEEEMRQKAEEEALAAANETSDATDTDTTTNSSASSDSDTETKKEKKEERVNHTFWEDDDGDRPLLSKADYEKFLLENNIAVNNVRPFTPE